MGEGARSVVNGSATGWDGVSAESKDGVKSLSIDTAKAITYVSKSKDLTPDGKTYRKGERYRSIVDVLADLRTRSAVLLAVEGSGLQVIHSWAIMRTRVLELLAVIDGGLLYRAEEV